MNGLVNVGGSSIAKYAWLKTPIVNGEKDTANAKYTVSANQSTYPESDIKGNHFYEQLPINISVPNGIIKEYYAATQDLNARTFIEFVNENISAGCITNVDSNYSYDSARNTEVHAIGLTDTKALLIYAHKYTIYGTILHIKDGQITVGTTTPIYTDSERIIYQYVSAAGLTESKVIIVTRYQYYIGGIIIDIVNDAIIPGEIIKLTSNTLSYSFHQSITKITDKKALLVHTGSSGYLNGTIVEINGTTITTGPLVTIRDKEYIIEKHAVATLTENLVFIGHLNDSDDCYACASLLSINGTTMSVLDSSKYINYSHIYGDFEAVALDENRVLLAYGLNSTKYSVVMNIITISNGTISNISDNISLYSAAYTSNCNTGRDMALVKIDANKVMFVCSCDDEQYTAADLLYIDNNTITTLGRIDINTDEDSGYCLTATLLPTSPDITVLVGHCAYHLGSGVASAMTVMYAPEKIKKSESVIQGVTKTLATTSNPGKIYVLE